MPHCWQPPRQYDVDLKPSGVLASTQQSNPDYTEAVSFIKNTAPGYGGAISLVDPVELNISAVAFTLNEAGFGGAVALTSTALTPVDIRSCRFEYNSATNGGALYLSGEGQTSLRGSLFRYNVAGETLFGTFYTCHLIKAVA